MSSKTIIDFWLEKEQRQDKPLCRDNAVRMCNSLLHHAFMNRQEMGHMLMMQTHILNAAFLRQSCASSVKHIAKAFQARSSDNEFLKDFPYFKDGQLSSSTTSIDEYFERNHAHDINIVNSPILEGEVRVKLAASDGEELEVHIVELSSNVGFILRNIYKEMGSCFRFSYDGVFLSPSREILPLELGMESRGEYTINVYALTEEELRAQECISRFLWHCHIQRRVKSIVARNLIADFVWRYREQRKAKNVISAFIWHHHQQSKARRVIGNLLWRPIALRRRQRRRSSAISIQRLMRGMLARRMYLSTLQPRLDDVRHFYTVWKTPIEHVPHSVQSLSGWALVRERMDLKRVDLLDEDGNLADADEKLCQALTVALSEDDETEEGGHIEIEDSFNDLTLEEKVTVREQENSPTTIDWSQFQVTSHVVKFMKNGDSKYREIFVKRMKQLAKGERSHKLQKPLKGCESIICKYLTVIVS